MRLVAGRGSYEWKRVEGVLAVVKSKVDKKIHEAV
jgi:hypothetical protein